MRPVLTKVSAPGEACTRLLRSHPQVADVTTGPTLRFSVGAWNREVRIGPGGEGPFGLMELMDNNPVVCADVVGVPSPAGTLALIALGPIVQAGMLTEAPAMMTNAPGSAEEIARELESVSWGDGVIFDRQDFDLGGVYAATVVAAIRMPEELEEIDALYDERYGGSFFIRRDEEGEWDSQLVRGRPEARYRLRIAPESPVGLLTIQVMADREGKCGAAQLVHAMNVMCGFEESLGIA